MAIVPSLEAAEWLDSDQAIRNETLQEGSNGWLDEEPSPNLDYHFIAKRFPIQQKEKTRLIDDFSI